jgi:hypothetical protein
LPKLMDDDFSTPPLNTWLMAEISYNLKADK